VHVLNKPKKKIECVNVWIFKRKESKMGLKMGHERFKNQNVNAYYWFLGVHYST